MYHVIPTSLDTPAPGAIRRRRPGPHAAAEVAHLGTDELRRLHDVAAAADATHVQLRAGAVSREEIAAVIGWRERRARRGTLIWLALWSLGVAATVTAAAKGWYIGAP